jgi:hypothetical protein
VEDSSSKPRKSLRKIKCYASLRDSIEEYSQPRLSTSNFDDETLVAQESLVSSPVQQEFPKAHSPPFPTTKNISPTTNPDPDDKGGLQICTTLLTNQLASTLFKHHPSEKTERASPLQILLMIKAYESLQHKIRQRLHRQRDVGKILDRDLVVTDRIIEGWLGALCAVYDRAKDDIRGLCGVIEEVERDESENWTPTWSEDSGRTFVDWV